MKEQTDHKGRIIEGYWKAADTVIKLESKVKPGLFLERTTPDKSGYPTPVPNVLTKTEAKEIYNLIVEKEKTADKVGYMGMSVSRITDEMLGNDEYETDTWLWPGDFAKHYVLKHKVRPTDEYLNYIGYKK